MSLRERIYKSDFGKSRTKQKYKDDCDINIILKKFGKIQGEDYLVNPAALPPTARFADVSDVPDMQTALNEGIVAKQNYSDLQKVVPALDGLSAQKFLEVYLNPENRPELERLGLLKPLAKPVGTEGTLDVTVPTGKS